jgi:2-polyprenyl-3-methyl-5-hydroxy-6-metoxy-1,4-benzoquinol methylase
MNYIHDIMYLSNPAAVSMADEWFEVAGPDHFWVRRRFEVLRRLAGCSIQRARELAEVGCGHGLLQWQIEAAFRREVTGFDLNEFALKRNISQLSKVCCYDVYQRNRDLQGRFDLVFLFDVLEHIDDEDEFLAAIVFHLASDGKLILNVPAGQWAYSEYDEAAGHRRRYSIGSLRNAAERNNLALERWSYWGLPLVPALMLRKLWLRGCRDQDKIISEGFNSRNTTINMLLRVASGCEPIPQTLLGTSLMAVLRVQRPSGY